MVYVTVLQSIVLGGRHQGAVACFRHEDEHSFRRGDSSLTAKKLVPDAASTGCSHVPSEQVVSVDCDHLCCDCDGTGWVLYRSETKDGEFEEAYHLCPKGHAPRYCMGSSSGNLCYRPATVRCGLGYYCMDHIVAIRENTDIDNPSEAI